MTRHDPIDGPPDALAELKANVSVPFNRARAMPRSVYTSEAFLKREMEDIFAKEWFCAGRSDQFAKPGDYITLELVGTPIMVLRDREGILRAQSNTCRHRMSTLLEGSGNTSTIVCPYHAWTYGLDGRLRGAPGMNLNESFERDEIRLPQIRCVEWLGWVLVSLNADAADPAEQLSDVEALIGDFHMEDYRQTFQETHRWNTNWKVLAENFMESYHLPVCHGGTIGGFVKLEEMECPPGLPAFNYHWILKDPDFFLSVAHPTNTRLVGERRRTTYLLAIYPSLMITLTPGYFWYLSLHPDGVDGVRILYGGGLSPDFAADPKAEAHFDAVKKLLDEVNEEDKGCTENVYRGLCSALAEPGPLSHLERPNYDFATWIADKLG
ncbi:Rieske 2Fe-2S domain-containing protein [Pikeienuella piscinae]|uniref:Rieske 2Fe-2S domain-containing protein n=1 Tax=Pikeienuella piscinae TaxID=2748098 RepID=A0A7L5C174_9RHOB|nr:SRPBCC family protein [Pikeienuella piscinae]QIE56226.1 Rieske 2Fe-2S domain-containing protein [Pikeienuella piscinae]